MERLEFSWIEFYSKFVHTAKWIHFNVSLCVLGASPTLTATRLGCLQSVWPLAHSVSKQKVDLLKATDLVNRLKICLQRTTARRNNEEAWRNCKEITRASKLWNNSKSNNPNIYPNRMIKRCQNSVSTISVWAVACEECDRWIGTIATSLLSISNVQQDFSFHGFETANVLALSLSRHAF